MIIGTYTQQAQHNVFSGTVDPTCPYRQLEPEDLRDMLCRCPAYHGDGVAKVGRLKQIIVQEAGLNTWNIHFTVWDTVLRVLVCPDFIDIKIPELVPVISKIENLARDFIYTNIHVKRLRLKQKREQWLPSPISIADI